MNISKGPFRRSRQVIARRTKERTPAIYVIGDSHATMYSGWDRLIPKWPEERFVRGRFPFFQPIRLGPVLAYNLCEYGKKSLGRERLFLALSCIPVSSKVLLCFGEIDCRAHIPRHAATQGRPTDVVAQECVDRYFRVVMEVRKQGFEVILSSVVPSAVDGVVSNPEYPHYGSSTERNAAAREFNRYLRTLCAKNSIFFLDVTANLLAENGMPLLEYFLDDVHLSHRSLAPAIEALRGQFPEMDFSIPYWSRIQMAASEFLCKVRRMRVSQKVVELAARFRL
jgi:hypothetical protein